MIMVSVDNMFVCTAGGTIKPMPPFVPNDVINVESAMLSSPMLMSDLLFVGSGVCTSSGIPTPCQPAITSWLFPSSDFSIGNVSVLISLRTMGNCGRGGMIMSIPTNMPPLIILS